MVNSASKRYLLPGYSRRRNSYCPMAACSDLGSLNWRPASAQFRYGNHGGIGFAGGWRRVIDAAVGVSDALVIATGTLGGGTAREFFAHALGYVELRARHLFLAGDVAGGNRQSQGDEQEPESETPSCGTGTQSQSATSDWQLAFSTQIQNQSVFEILSTPSLPRETRMGAPRP
jgi:hypothetical protein